MGIDRTKEIAKEKSTEGEKKVIDYNVFFSFFFTENGQES